MGPLSPLLLVLSICIVRAAEHVTTLHNGVKVPKLGLGCASGVRKQHVGDALAEGYRFLDTAQASVWGYHEAEVGEAVSESSVPREEIFLQTKIHPQDLGYHSTLHAFQRSLTSLQTTWLDSLLLHKPRCWGDVCQREPEGTWQDSWRALEELYQSGQVKAIGICDVDEHLLSQLLRMEVKPHIVQNWMDPFHQDTRVRRMCLEHGIVYQAYSSLGTQWSMRGYKENPVLEDEGLQAMAGTHSRSVAEVVLSWALSQGAVVIPASKSSPRRQANMNSLEFQLAENELASIAQMDGHLESQLVIVRNAAGVPVEMFWVDGMREEKIDVFQPGESKQQRTVPGHRLVFKHGSQVIHEHVVQGGHRRAYEVIVEARKEL